MPPIAYGSLTNDHYLSWVHRRSLEQLNPVAEFGAEWTEAMQQVMAIGQSGKTILFCNAPGKDIEYGTKGLRQLFQVPDGFRYLDCRNAQGECL